MVSRLGGEGELEVFVADEQAGVTVDTARWARLAEGVLVAEGVRGHAELSLLFVSETDIDVLNEEFLGHPGPTDVLAFPITGSSWRSTTDRARSAAAPIARRPIPATSRSCSATS